MCGRYELHTHPAALALAFGLPYPPEIGPRYNIAPTQDVPVVRLARSGQRELAQLRWGLVPRWAKDPSIGARLINARAETLAEKPAFRTALRRHRVLIPADGFYEWKSDPRRGQAAAARRHEGRRAVRTRGSDRPLALARGRGARHLRHRDHAGQRAAGADARSHACDRRARGLRALARRRRGRGGRSSRALSGRGDGVLSGIAPGQRGAQRRRVSARARRGSGGGGRLGACPRAAGRHGGRARSGAGELF